MSKKDLFEIDDNYLVKLTPCGKEKDSLTIPENILYIGSFAFFENKKLKKITLPANLNTIEKDAFYRSGIQHLKMPDKVHFIDMGAFSESDLVSIVLPKALTEIVLDTFSDCKNLKTVTIHDKIKIIAPNSFYGCTSLETVYFTGSKEQWDKLVFDKDTKNNLSNAKIVFLKRNNEVLISHYKKKKAIRII